MIYGKIIDLTMDLLEFPIYVFQLIFNRTLYVMVSKPQVVNLMKQQIYMVGHFCHFVMTSDQNTQK